MAIVNGHKRVWPVAEMRCAAVGRRRVQRPALRGLFAQVVAVCFDCQRLLDGGGVLEQNCKVKGTNKKTAKLGQSK